MKTRLTQSVPFTPLQENSLMTNHKNTLIVSTAALLLAFGTTAGAAVITPTSATSTSTIGGVRTDECGSPGEAEPVAE